MSCGCDNKKFGQELERARRLAKASARMDDVVMVLYRKSDGTYDFAPETDEIDNEIIEYVTPY